MMIDAGEDKSMKQTKKTTINLSHENRQWIDSVKDYISMTRIRKRVNENENKNGNKNVNDALNEDANEGVNDNENDDPLNAYTTATKKQQKQFTRAVMTLP